MEHRRAQPDNILYTPTQRHRLHPQAKFHHFQPPQNDESRTMPWKETNIMQQRIQFIQAWLTKRYTKVELCKQFNISRPTADKWIKHHQQVGFDGLAELSRRPQHSPHATPQWISEWLIAQKLKRPDWGAKNLLDLFARTFPAQHKPADSTGDLILARAGLVKPRKRRRKVSADSSLTNAPMPTAHGVWTSKDSLP